MKSKIDTHEYVMSYDCFGEGEYDIFIQYRYEKGQEATRIDPAFDPYIEILEILHHDDTPNIVREEAEDYWLKGSLEEDIREDIIREQGGR